MSNPEKHITYEIHTFLETQFPSTRKSPLSELSKIWIERIHHLVLEGDQQWKESNILYVPIPMPDTFPKANTFQYIPNEYQKCIIELSKSGGKCSFKINKREIDIYFVFPKEKEPSISQMNKYIRKMYLWLFVATSYSSPTCSPQIQVYIYFLDKCKEIGSMLPLTEYNVNTGFTSSCKPNNEICIYREEEWFKVFIHETMHTLDLDFSGDHVRYNNIANPQIFSVFPLNIDLRLYETYCEMCAEIINIYFISYLSTKNKENFQLIVQKMEESIKREQSFSLFQASKILYYYGIKYRDLYELTESAKNARLYKYKESTPVFSYYILKSMSMFHVNAYLEWCMNQNKGSLSFVKKDENVKSYCDWFRKYHNEPLFIQTIENMETWYSNPQNIRNHPRIVKTLRMTANEIPQMK